MVNEKMRLALLSHSSIKFFNLQKLDNYHVIESYQF